jgi:hypothetical protein
VRPGRVAMPLPPACAWPENLGRALWEKWIKPGRLRDLLLSPIIPHAWTKANATQRKAKTSERKPPPGISTRIGKLPLALRPRASTWLAGPWGGGVGLGASLVPDQLFPGVTAPPRIRTSSWAGHDATWIAVWTPPLYSRSFLLCVAPFG